MRHFIYCKKIPVLLFKEIYLVFNISLCHMRINFDIKSLTPGNYEYCTSAAL